MLVRLLICLILSVAPLTVMAEDPAPEKESDYVSYIELKPFITNFGGQGQTRFLKCEVSIQVGSSEAHHAVNHHMAHIRNDLVFLLSAQTEDTVKTVEAQQILAKKALDKVQKILLDEEGEAFVSDLFFTSFVVQ
ncbi:flagellar basal body-associated FliL family protein [Neptuniibacter sp. CAU 1671]|uniref:flagellar basal body-associated FliL family protein n=1 Tax=Neptuniibacter sp. CAU 1671 TaxID=3032593 RepID=UPI0023DCB2E4|nr:flagellar basal body-associated FliL family protein [Neptuniibacter sp. CAU 1671]MDF2182599.1 flagellar basal body-associated FliL family protein [Neptuniibacter sp. CAU 1671]